MPTIQEVNEALEVPQNEEQPNDVQESEENNVTIEEVQKQMEMDQQQRQENMRNTPVMTEEEMRNEKQRKVGDNFLYGKTWTNSPNVSAAKTQAYNPPLESIAGW